MSSDALLIKDAAKLLQIGSKTLYDLLHKKGFIAPGTNFPRDDMVKAGYFKSDHRTRRFTKPGDGQQSQMPYYVTVVTDAGMDFLRELVTEYKASVAPAPGTIKITVEIGDPAIAHALVRYTQLLEKPSDSSFEETAEFCRALDVLSKSLPNVVSRSLAHNKKTLSHPKFQTVFQPQETRHAS